MAVDLTANDGVRDRDAGDVGVEDVLPVGSRISWGAILAGAVLALALYFLLTLLGAAIGLSVSDDASAGELGTGAAIWAVLVTALCLFVGGYAASHFTVGEDKVEAAVYGALVWAVVFAMLLWLMASGVRAGFGAMVGVATAGGAAVGSVADAIPGDALSADALSGLTAADVEQFARDAGVDQAQIDQMKQSADEFAAEAQDRRRPAGGPRRCGKAGRSSRRPRRPGRHDRRLVGVRGHADLHAGGDRGRVRRGRPAVPPVRRPRPAAGRGLRLRRS